MDSTEYHESISSIEEQKSQIGHIRSRLTLVQSAYVDQRTYVRRSRVGAYVDRESVAISFFIA